MSKRAKLALVIIVGLILLAIGAYFLISPFLTPSQTEEVPIAEAPGTATLQNMKPAPQKANVPSVATSTPVEAPKPRTAEDYLREMQNRARATVERIGSGSSQNGFAGYQDAFPECTASLKKALLAEQAELVMAHPATGTAFGVMTRSVSSKVVKGTYGDATVVLEIQAIRTEDAGNPRAPTSRKAQQALLTYAKQSDGTYLIDSIAWKDLAM